MALSYVNRKKQVWLLFEGKTKLGKPRYFLSQADSVEKGKRLTAVPDGHEIFETYGQLFCRKRLPVVITDEEVEVVKKELAKHRLGDHIVERKGKDLIVHKPQTLHHSEYEVRSFGFLAARDEVLRATRHYQPIMRFQLGDQEKRLFVLSRWCFRGDRGLTVDQTGLTRMTPSRDLTS
ncbi:MAG: hypothetical protein HY815_01735 [Candidatus Riflebacteria bacterium]|nr:hypothetical protein [Candidatus Riflebacteria bacterium]